MTCKTAWTAILKSSLVGTRLNLEKSWKNLSVMQVSMTADS